MREALMDVQAVLYFAATSVPAISKNDPGIDLPASMPPLISLLNAMAAYCPDARLIFPSSGGAIYGSCETAANEETPIRPLSAYALGKAVADRQLRFMAMSSTSSSISCASRMLTETHVRD